MNKQILPVFNPLTEQFLFYKERALVHKHGDWHKGIQANIIRRNKTGTFDILIQIRSDVVDIGKSKYDQSLAVQMINLDNLEELNTLKRGLLSELNIKEFNHQKIKTNVRIIKLYEDQKGIVNRELVSLFIISLENIKKLRIMSPKVKELQWIEWKQFIKFFKKNRLLFTKTSQFYFGNNKIIKHIEQASYNFLKIKTPKYKHKPIKLSNKTVFHVNILNITVKTYFFENKNIDKIIMCISIYE